MSNTLNNWKSEWYDVMLAAAKWVLYRTGQGQVNVDELINYAWLDSIRRMGLDSPISHIRNNATKSMNQYIVGGSKSRKRNIGKLKLRAKTHSIGVLDFQRDKNSYSYDDVDAILVAIRELPIRIQEIIILRLQGMTFKVIGKKYCVSESRAHQIFYEGLREFVERMK